MGIAFAGMKTGSEKHDSLLNCSSLRLRVTLARRRRCAALAAIQMLFQLGEKL